MNGVGKNILLFVVIGVLLASIVSLFQNPTTGIPASNKTLAYSEFLDDVTAGRVGEVQLQDQTLKGTYKDQKDVIFSTQIPENTSVVEDLRQHNVKITALPSNAGKAGLGDILMAWLPMIILVGVWFYFMRQMQSSSGKAMHRSVRMVSRAQPG